MPRFKAFLYSRRNIIGSLLALGGVALHLAGLIVGLEWLPITAGLYLIGLLLVPGEPGLDIQLGAAQDAGEIRDGLDRLTTSLRGRVADDLLAKVASIRASILATLQVEGGPGDAADPNVYLIRQTALTYLPDAFAAYLRVPRETAERRPIADGRTPHDVLLEQLELMDSRLTDVADDMVRHDSEKLLANGRFLAEKFGVSSLRVGDAAAIGSTVTSAASVASHAAAVPVGSEVPASVAEPVAERERVR